MNKSYFIKRVLNNDKYSYNGEMNMASNIEFVEYVCDQISGAGDITYKKCLVIMESTIMKNNRINM